MLRDRLLKREIRLQNVLQFIISTVWRTLFGKQADLLERANATDGSGETCTRRAAMRAAPARPR